MRTCLGLSFLLALFAGCSDDSTVVKQDHKTTRPPDRSVSVDTAAADLAQADQSQAADHTVSRDLRKDGAKKPDAAKTPDKSVADKKIIDKNLIDKTVVDKGPPTEARPLEAAPPVGHLVINEVDYNQAGTDSAEFLEIYNPTSSAVSLTNLAVVFVNGGLNPPAVYLTVNLSTAGASLGAGQYLVLRASTVTVPAGVLTINFANPTNDIQNGNPDGVALVDTSAKTVIDALSYGGAITNAPLFAGSTTTLVEGTVLDPTVIDSETSPAGSLCRYPNGKDTDNANADWKLCSTPTPGAANTL